MIADVILGNNIDTSMWIKELKERMCENIFVVDYSCDYNEDPVTIKGVNYISSSRANDYFKNYDSISFYKSMYIYPGMISLRSTTRNDEEN